MGANSRTGGNVVVETLEALGITHVFGIPGQHALGLFEALNGSGLTYVSSRVENNAAFAADGFARISGSPAALFLSTGPGALTALAGLQEAYASGVPVVVVSSQVPDRGIGGRRNGLLHQLDEQKRSVENVTKVQFTAHASSSIPSMLQDAWEAAMTAPQGPVWVEIPEDVLLGETSIPLVDGIERSIPPVKGNGTWIRQAAELLKKAERPVILSGGGAVRSGAGPLIMELAQRVGALVACSPGGVSSVPADDPLVLAHWIEDWHTTEVLNEADVLLAVGTALGEVTTNYFTFSPTGHIIQIDAEPLVLESNYASLGIRADAAEGVRAILSELPQSTSPSRWGDVTAEEKAAQIRQAVEARLDAQPLGHERAFMDALRRAVPDTTATFWDMTIAAYWAWNVWDARAGAFSSAQGAGGLGYGFPAALGGAVASGERTLAVAGDGSAMYSIAELASAKQHNIPVTWLIVDDGGYGILREYMNDAFGRATATELSRPDFRALSEAFGVPAVRVSTDELESALRASLTAGPESGPNVVIVDTVLRMWEPTHVPHIAPKQKGVALAEREDRSR
ncbi:Acetolactate synthase isozyme 2 large subunit [Corynebacterium capitovis DSM 44611]|uniref:thiamine pyrophosphate-binding protein n=1 Tax=Corynebacterium capitovis TaxID=131081 RepID=UPI000378803C|nr:thiamine pyrophosphate-binding protein [Corynebacterium capitovis]WKD58383.1 Acetolactate synthase isozyme 2 large subunit [Corynebacterium capitovis DSM 44611]